MSEVEEGDVSPKKLVTKRPPLPKQGTKLVTKRPPLPSQSWEKRELRPRRITIATLERRRNWIIFASAP